MSEEVNEIKIERVFDTPLEQVWKAWTEPEKIKKWWGPQGFTAPSIEIDFRVGGKYVYAMRGPAGTEWDKNMYSGGEFKEIVPMKRIVATDSFTDEKGEVVPGSEYGMSSDFPTQMLLTVEFEEIDGKTKLTLVHRGMPAGPDSEGATAGWNQSLDKLSASL